MPLSWSLTPARRRRPIGAPALLDQYAHSTPRPIYCAALLLPLAAVYEIGIRIATTGDWPPRMLVAHSLMHALFGWVGASGQWLPAVALILTLVVWQVYSGGRCRVRPWIVAAMLGESILLAAPLLVLKALLLPEADAGVTRGVELLLGIGAGVYEELVFRFYLIALLTGLIVSLARVPLRTAAPVIIGIAGLIFAVAHVRPIGAEAWAWSSFFVRSFAGAYLSLLYVQRGLGIAAGCHVAHNAFSVLL